MRSEHSMGDVRLLGCGHTDYVSDYAPHLLETFDNQHPDHDYVVKFVCPKFTSVCPKTGQPDFATLYINYWPRRKMVESKSLKLYLCSFRNHGDFHEDCVNTIRRDLVALMQPKYLEVYGEFTPRGGIAIHPYTTYGQPDTSYADLAAERLRCFALSSAR